MRLVAPYRCSRLECANNHGWVISFPDDALATDIANSHHGLVDGSLEAGMLPNYIFVGPTRSGTTWIDAYLRNRNDVVLPTDFKETCFFDKQYENGIDWYDSQFRYIPDATECIEVAPSLMVKPYAAERLARDLPDVEVICTLRNPIDRAVSHYFHYLSAGVKDIGFIPMCEKYVDIISAGLYNKNVLKWRALLGPERVHFLLYDEMIEDINAFCMKLCEIIQIAYVEPGPVAETKLNEAGVPRYRFAAYAARHGAGRLRHMGANRLVNVMKFAPMMRFIYGKKPSRQKRQYIHEEAMQFFEIFRRDFEQLEDLIGIDLSAWKEPILPH